MFLKNIKIQFAKNFFVWLLIVITWVLTLCLLIDMSGGQSATRRIINTGIAQQIEGYQFIIQEGSRDNKVLKELIIELDGKGVTHFLHRYGHYKELAYNYLTKNYLEEKEYGECAKYGKKLVEFYSNSYENRILYGDCLLGLHEKGKAFDEYYKAWNMYPLAPGLMSRLLPLVESNGDVSPEYLKSIYNSYPMDRRYSLQFYFSETEDFVGRKMFVVEDVIANGVAHTYEIPLSKILMENNMDTIRRLRIDPLQDSEIDGLVVKIESLVFQGRGMPDIIISDFSDWETTHNTSRIGSNVFSIDGDDPYITSPRVTINGYDSALINLKIRKNL